jgi:hypothetical protein
MTLRFMAESDRSGQRQGIYYCRASQARAGGRECVYLLVDQPVPSRWGPKSSNSDAVDRFVELRKQVEGTALRPGG